MAASIPDLGPEPLEPFTREDLPGLALSKRELDALLRSQAIIQPLRGVYVDARLADDALVKSKAVALVLPDGAALARRTAAWMHGIDARGPGEVDQPLPVECIVPAARGSVPRRPGLVAFEAPLPPEDIAFLDGVPVTSPDRTALDLARYTKVFMGLALLDAFGNAKLIDLEALHERVDGLKGQRGIGQARRLLGLCDPRAESFGESWLRLRAIDAGFPRPDLQIWVTDDNGLGIYRLDLGWPTLKVAVEYDGEEFHSSAEHRLHDVRRRAELAQRWGWHCIGVGRGEVLGQSLRLEKGIGALLGLTPQILRRSW
ncbi:MAG TPA: type IV toxin-antitoxin system AbiEi family antitoxin [Actinomycetales bacterium]|nr:type IV toxin-antitoxin system AbiEi family antitoxin [Actinomycetales bacterium]